MRPTYYLFLAAAVIAVSSGNGLSKEPSLPMDVVANAVDVDGKRFLRSYKAADDDSDGDNEGEERGFFNIFKRDPTSDLLKELKTSEGQNRLFRSWQSGDRSKEDVLDFFKDHGNAKDVADKYVSFLKANRRNH